MSIAVINLRNCKEILEGFSINYNENDVNDIIWIDNLKTYEVCFFRLYEIFSNIRNMCAHKVKLAIMIIDETYNYLSEKEKWKVKRTIGAFNHEFRCKTMLLLINVDRELGNEIIQYSKFNYEFDLIAKVSEDEVFMKIVEFALTHRRI